MEVVVKACNFVVKNISLKLKDHMKQTMAKQFLIENPTFYLRQNKKFLNVLFFYFILENIVFFQKKNNVLILKKTSLNGKLSHDTFANPSLLWVTW
jgi:hypothetical protein